MLFVFGKVQPFLKEIREKTQSPAAFATRKDHQQEQERPGAICDDLEAGAGDAEGTKGVGSGYGKF